MLQDIDDSSLSIPRLPMITEASASIVHHSRKRKCQGHHLKLPIPKHTRPASLKNNPQGSSFQTHLTSQKTESKSAYEPDSVKDSNSLQANSDSMSCSNDLTKSDPESSNAYSYNRIAGCEYDSCGSTTDGVVDHSNLEDHPEEFELHGNHVSSECENDEMELGEEDKDLQDLLYSDCSKVNPNMFVLSSGRWVIKQDAQSATREPTIDQEFEQYFSTLML